MPGPETLLILGGTAEARALADAAVEAFADRLKVVTSLAGRIDPASPVPGELRVGGFGGAAGLAAYLRAEDIGLVIDATHPFAAIISVNALRRSAGVIARAARTSVRSTPASS